MKKSLSLLLFFIATLLWGMAFVAQKAAAELPTFTLCAIRSGIAAVFLIGVVIAFDKIRKNGRRLFKKNGRPDLTKSELLGGLVTGAILALGTSVQQFGLSIGTSASKAAFITALYVVIVPMISALIGKKPSLNAYIGAIISVVGFYLLCIDDELTVVLSDLLVLACALVFAFHIISVDHFSPKCDGIRMSLVQFAVAFILNLIPALIFELPVDHQLLSANMPSVLYLAICSSGIAYTLQIIAQRDADPTVSSVLLSMESVFGVIGAAIFLHERMSLKEYIGCAVVLFAVILAQIDFKAIGKKRKDDNIT